MKQVLTLFLVFVCTFLHAQNAVQILSAPLHVMNCPDVCTTLYANFPKPLKTNAYTVSSIPFSPVAITGTGVNVTDDNFSNAIPLGFDFCFFDNVYSQCYIADNGVLTFNPAYNAGNCNNNIQQTLPYFNSSFPDNAIFALFMDINPNLGGTVSYATVGTAPYRKFVLKYQSVRLFGNTCAATTSTFQVVLSETLHTIEMFITGKVACDNDPNNHANYGTVGIQNIGATVFYTAPGKHASIFTTSNEGIKFTPSGPSNYTLNWLNKWGQVIATNTDSLLICPSEFPYDDVKAQLTIYCPLSVQTDSVVITKPLPVFNAIQVVQPFCAYDTNGAILINATVAAPPPMYAINNGPLGPSNIFTGLAAGLYTITVQDANGCKKDTTVLVEPVVVLWMVVDSAKNPVCPDSNGMVIVHFMGGLAPYTVTWSNGDIGFMCDSIGPGGVIATVTDANGCTQDFPLILPQDSMPMPQSMIIEPVCGDSNGSIALTITNGTPAYTLLWNTGDTALAINNLMAGIYSVTITDSKGCVTVFSTNLEDVDVLITSKSSTNTKCGINNGTATITASLGVPPYTYLWQPSGQVTATATNLAPGIHYCTTMDTSACFKVDTFVILPSLGLINNITFSNANCDTSNGSIYLNGVQNAQGVVTQLWSTGQTGNVISGLNAGTYWIITTDGIGCVKTDTIVLLNDGKPQLFVASYTPPLCNGDKGSAILGGNFGTAPYKYSMDGIVYSSDAQLNNILAGVYTIYISDANSCTNSTTVTFTQPPLIDLTYTSDSVVCFNDMTATVSYSASGGTPGYQYSFNNGIYSGDTADYQNTQGIYKVLVKDANNCTRAFNVVVPGPEEALNVEFDKKNVYCFETNTGSFTANIVGGWKPYSYTWDNNATGLTFKDLGETKMTISVVDNMGCKIDREVDIEILKCCKMVVPNAFTPNSDGKNDFLYPMAISEVSALKFSIYDRWGKLIFATKSLGEKWDGTDNEVPCNMGVYFYMLEYNCPFELKTFKLKGDITLIR